MSVDKLLTAAELALYLQVKAETIREWHRNGLIPAMRATQRPILFDLQQVKDCLRKHADRRLADAFNTTMANIDWHFRNEDD